MKKTANLIAIIILIISLAFGSFIFVSAKTPSCKCVGFETKNGRCIGIENRCIPVSSCYHQKDGKVVCLD